MKSRLPAASRVLLALPFMAVLGACFLVVDTDDLAGAGVGSTRDSGLVEAGDGPPVSTVDAGDASEAAAPDPCAGEPILCETFDDTSTLPAYPQNTDPESAITLDDAGSLSPPHSARFVIEPSNNNSADATIDLRTTAGVADFVFEAALHIERSEPGQVARLLLISNGDDGFYLDQNGEVKNSGDTFGNVGPVPTGRWITIRIEMRIASGNATFVIDGKTSGPFQVPGTWQPDPVLARLGVSEANAPTTGWLVRWDNIVIRKL